MISIFVGNSKAQVECPPGAGDWLTSTVTVDIGRYGPGGEVNFRWRKNGDDYQVIIDWNSFQNNSDFMPDNALKKMLEYAAVENVFPKVNFPYSGYVYVFFVRECKTKVKLVVELDQSIQLACCDDGATLPEYYSRLIGQDLHYFYNVYKEVPCGYKCCARRYYCTREWDNILDKWVTSVSQPEILNVTNCAGTSSYRNCLPPFDFLPCEDASCDGYY